MGIRGLQTAGEGDGQKKNRGKKRNDFFHRHTPVVSVFMVYGMDASVLLCRGFVRLFQFPVVNCYQIIL